MYPSMLETWRDGVEPRLEVLLVVNSPLCLDFSRITGSWLAVILSGQLGCQAGQLCCPSSCCHQTFPNCCWLDADLESTPVRETPNHIPSQPSWRRLITGPGLTKDQQFTRHPHGIPSHNQLKLKLRLHVQRDNAILPLDTCSYDGPAAMVTEVKLGQIAPGICCVYNGKCLLYWVSVVFSL